MKYKELTREFVMKVSNGISFINLEKYVALIEEKNKVMNLTGFTGDTLWKEGIYESLVSLYEAFDNPENKELLDIGAGAGFPSVPYKIVFPSVKLTIIEPQRKRIVFLEEVIQHLKIDISLIVNRAENVKNKVFDLITARAVAPLYALLEISNHLGKINSCFVFLKGPSVFTEQQEAKSIIEILKIKGIVKKIDDSMLERAAYVYQYVKMHETPKGYPRAWNKIVAR